MSGGKWLEPVIASVASWSSYRFQRGPFHRQVKWDFTDIRTSVIGGGPLPFVEENAQNRRINRLWMNFAGVGILMEDSIDLMKATNQECREALKELKEIVNSATALGDVVKPLLAKQVTEIRNTRMTLVSEVHSILSELKDVRKFFLDETYSVEMEHLERFVRVCREIKELKESGVFDAVCESAIKLAIKEVEK